MSTIKTNNLQHTGSADVNLALDSSGYVAIQDGAAGTPALYFSGDSNTGIYSPGADSVAISTGGSARATVDSSGRFLVGTSSSSATGKVHISGGFTYGGQIHLTADGASGTIIGGDLLGRISFGGSIASGTVAASTDAARIESVADATWSSNSDTPTRLVFSTTADGASSPTERMRIRNDGRIWMGTTSEIRGYNREQLSVKGGSGEAISFQSNALTYAAMVFRDADSGAGTHYIGYWENSSGTNVGAITHNNTNTTYATTSDYRLKENVEPIVGACDRLNQLKPCRFNFIADPDNTVDGFLAHEAQAVVPESVIGQKDAINEDGSVKPQGIDQSKLVPLLTAALQEAIGEIESLKARVAALESA